MNFPGMLLAVQCYFSFSLEDYDKLHVCTSAAFCVLESRLAVKYCKSVLNWEQLVKQRNEKKVRVFALCWKRLSNVGCVSDAGMCMFLLANAAFFSCWSEQRIESDLAKGESRDSRQLLLEEEMDSESLQPYFTCLHWKNSLKMLSECLPGRWVLGCKERASKYWQRC